MDQRLQSDRRAFGHRTRVRDPCLSNYPRQIRLAMLMRHYLRGALPLALAVLALAVRVPPPGMARAAVPTARESQPLGARRPRARRRTIAAAPVTDPAEEKLALAARTPSVDQIHEAAVAARPVDLSTRTCESG
jgi:hypothetical protein